MNKIPLQTLAAHLLFLFGYHKHLLSLKEILFLCLLNQHYALLIKNPLIWPYNSYMIIIILFPDYYIILGIFLQDNI